MEDSIDKEEEKYILYGKEFKRGEARREENR